MKERGFFVKVAKWRLLSMRERQDGKEVGEEGERKVGEGERI